MSDAPDLRDNPLTPDLTAADLAAMREQEHKLGVLAARSSTTELGRAVFPGWIPLWYLDVISDHLDACLRSARCLPV